MLISLPNDDKNLEYHIIDLLGETVHAYRDADAARRRMEGDQRLAIWCLIKKRWITDAPRPIREVLKK